MWVKQEFNLFLFELYRKPTCGLNNVGEKEFDLFLFELYRKPSCVFGFTENNVSEKEFNLFLVWILQKAIMRVK